jgi:integrator complex subunit 1
MIWDPYGPARKPPREVGDLLLSVETSFSLPEALHRSTNPDFLLMTLGGTSRGAIERAYEWLIPVISRFPDIIGRLPSSASCFLLLRAYGSDAGERARLKELSSPLLSHVADCLYGNFGKLDCVTAFDLLMSDVASIKAERRRCARRVLHDSLQTVGGQQSWMIKMLGMKYSNDLVADGIRYMVRNEFMSAQESRTDYVCVTNSMLQSLAATFERGGVLKCPVLALEAYLLQAGAKGMECEVNFPDLLIGLVSNRPGVLAETMSSFSELRSLVVRVVRAEYGMIGEPPNGGSSASDTVRLTLRKVPSFEHDVVHIRLALLQSTCVLLSIWEDAEQSLSVDELVDALLRIKVDENEDIGLASATIVDSNLPALTVESVRAPLFVSCSKPHYTSHLVAVDHASQV